jgi:hypothetical protein
MIISCFIDYFGGSARNVFFSQYQHLAKHRLLEGKHDSHSNSLGLSESATVSISQKSHNSAKLSLKPAIPYALDFPFAPKRPELAEVPPEPLAVNLSRSL